MMMPEEPQGPNVGLIAGIAITVLAAAAVVVFLVVRKKKKKAAALKLEQEFLEKETDGKDD